MTDGFDLSIVLSGATLATLAGLVIRVWLANRGQKIGPQPFRIAPVDQHPSVKVCDERHKAIENQTENLFCRMSVAEQRIATVEATVSDIKEQYKSIDGRLNEVLRRMP